jgi:hypothetical protein
MYQLEACCPVCMPSGAHGAEVMDPHGCWACTHCVACHAVHACGLQALCLCWQLLLPWPGIHLCNRCAESRVLPLCGIETAMQVHGRPVDLPLLVMRSSLGDPMGCRCCRGVCGREGSAVAPSKWLGCKTAAFCMSWIELIPVDCLLFPRSCSLRHLTQRVVSTLATIARFLRRSPEDQARATHVQQMIRTLHLALSHTLRHRCCW